LSNRSITFVCLITLLLLGGVSAWAAPPPRFEHLTVDDGLPENSVRSILQDRRGFLWFGTHNGLARYNGYEMESFLPDPGDSGSIFPRFLIAMAEDDSGMIWIGSYANGLSRYDPRSGLFTNYRPDRTDPAGLPGAQVNALACADDGLWLALGDAGLCRFDGQRFERVAIRAPEDPGGDIAQPALWSLLVTDEQLWVGTESEGLAVRNRRGGSWRIMRHDPDNPRSLPSNQVTDIFRDEAGRIWVATRTGLALYRGDGGFEVFLPDRTPGAREENYLVQIAADESGRLWIGSAVGLYAFSPHTGEFELFSHDPRDPGSPVLGPALSVLVDRSGIVWAGSWHTGLNKYDPWSRKFEVLLHDPDDPGSLDDDAVVSLYEDPTGVLWVGTGSLSSGGTSGGLNREDPATGRFAHIAAPHLPTGQVRRINTICEDHQGRVWLGSNLGVLRLDDNRQSIIRPPELAGETGPLLDGSVTDMLIDTTGRLWVTFWQGGLHRFDPATDAWAAYWHDPRDEHTLTSNELVNLCLDTDGRIWIGTDQSGLNLYDAEIDGFRRFPSSESGADAIHALHPAQDGRIWASTGAGVRLFDAVSGVVWSVSSSDGLPAGMLGQVQVDRAGKLWISSGRGLVRVDPASHDLALFDERDGLPRNELHFASLTRSDGRMYFGGHHGLIVFDPDLVQASPFVPPVVLTDFRVADQRLPVGGDSPFQQTLQETGTVRLGHHQNDLSIEFSALHFAHPERNSYRFRLQPYDADWRTAGPERTAHYTNLDPGRYEFQVIGSNADNIWNNEATSLVIVIDPPWWRTRWANGLYVLLIAVGALVVYRMIVQRERIRAALEIQRVEAQQLQQLDRLKSRFFTNISHEFRTPLTLVKASLQRMQEDPETAKPSLLDMMARNADRLEQLIEQLLDLSRLEAGHMPVRWQRGDWRAYLRALLATYDVLAQGNEIELACRWPEVGDEGWFDADLLDKVAGNLLTNALKFTPAGGRIDFVAAVADRQSSCPVPGSKDGPAGEPFQLPAHRIRLAVANSGSYIPPDELSRIFDRFHQIAGSDGGDGRGTGVGLALVKELIQWYGGSIEVQSTREQGTVFTVELPVFLESPLPVESADADVTPDDIDRVLNDDTEDDLEPETAAGSGPTILIVEDHPDLRAFLREELIADFVLLEAPDGRAGLDLARQEIPDLVLTDVMMPELDGFELCRRLKTDERTNHIPVVMLTAKTESASRLAGLEIGADDYLTKPFDIAELKQRLSNLLEQRRLLRDRFARNSLDPGRRSQPVESADELFLERARDLVAANLEDPDFRVDGMCRGLGMSRTQLHRKLKAVADQSTGEFLRNQRLLRAAEMLAGNYGNVTEVAYAVGFRNLSHFAKTFREQFGVAPSEYDQ